MTHYTCDRCGADVHGPGKSEQREVVIEWPDLPLRGDHETVAVTFSINRPYVDFETPDLCDDCYAFILTELASLLDSDRQPASVPARAEVESGGDQ